MKRLYVSDLDGTLLDGGAGLPDAWKARLNALLGEGLAFTIATARSPQSGGAILEGLEIRLPRILLNGVLLYDGVEGRMLDLASMEPHVVRGCVEVFEGHGLSPIVYSVDAGGAFRNSYRRILPGLQEAHSGKAVREGDPRYRRVEDFRPALEEERCFFVSTIAHAHELEAAIDELGRRGLPWSIYDDVYTGGRFLECCAADKGTAALALKRRLGADELVAIGDNLNDLPMLRVADRAIVVEGGHPDALAAADEVIGPCEKGGVIDFLEREWRGG